MNTADDSAPGDGLRTPEGDLLPVVPERSSVVSVEAARMALQEIQILEEAQDFSHKASAAAKYFHHAKETRDLSRQMVEVQIWAERRAGELLDRERLENGRSEYIKELGSVGKTIRRWICFASVDEKALRSVINQSEELTATGVERRLNIKSVKRVERGIYLSATGQFIIRWRQQGISRSRLAGLDLASARRQLLVATGKVKPDPEPGPREYTAVEMLTDSYRSIRHALGLLDRLPTGLSADTKALVSAAFADLYRAEDSISAALRITQ